MLMDILNIGLLVIGAMLLLATVWNAKKLYGYVASFRSLRNPDHLTYKDFAGGATHRSATSVVARKNFRCLLCGSEPEDFTIVMISIFEDDVRIVGWAHVDCVVSGITSTGDDDLF